MAAFSPVEEIKNRLDILEVIGSYLKLEKTGANWRTVCPFHSEKKPSFFVSPARQIWHCFGCGLGGDIFRFVMQIEGVEFGDALKILAQRAGVELKRERPELRTQRSRLYEICELACRFFEKQLQESKVGKEAKSYLLSRGIKQESIKKWRLGYAPDSWQSLSDFLISRGYQKDEVERGGLGLTSEKGSFYDRFRGRIIFPIFDFNSQVIGFSGRVFKEQEKQEIAKYVNTPNTLIYDKSRVLYGLNFAKSAIRKQNSCIIVEGNTDAILVSQAGFENVVAVSGTALTPYQLKIIKRYTENLLTCFDMDFAGDSATKRSIELAQTMGFNIKVILLPESSDPAEIIAKNPELFGKLLKEARPILNFYFETTFSRINPNLPEGKREISKILLPIIKKIPNSVERSFWIQELARRLEVSEDAVLEELSKTKESQESSYMLENQEPLQKPKKSRKELLQERLLLLALKFPAYQELIGEKYKMQLLGNQDYLNYLSLKADLEEVNQKDALSEIQFCLKEIKSLEIKEQLDLLSKEIRKAESEKDFSKIEELTKNFHQLTKKIQLS